MKRSDQAQCFLDALDKFPQADPVKLLPTYIGAATAQKNTQALSQLEMMQSFLDNRVSPAYGDPVVEGQCKKLAEKMVRDGKWNSDVMEQF